jgi:hypothetical protein
MVVILGEGALSRAQTIGWKDSTASFLYFVSGSEDEAEVNLAVQAIVGATYTPPTITGLTLPTLVIQDYSLDPLGGGLWKVTVRYNQAQPRKTNYLQYNFDTGGGTQKIFASLMNRGVYAPAGVGLLAGAKPNFHGLIGVTADAVEGCEITIPVFNWSEQHYIPKANFTDGYLAALYQCTGKINNAPWRIYTEAEVLFLGASGSLRNNDDWEVTFKFAASPSATGLSFDGGAISGVNKRGWDYLWIRYEDAVDTGANVLTKTIKAVSVDQVYQEADFTTLAIGDTGATGQG